jgi:pyruvate dehydrogenase (quinone)
MSQTVADYLIRRLYAWGIRRLYSFPEDAINGTESTWCDMDSRFSRSAYAFVRSGH